MEQDEVDTSGEIKVDSLSLEKKVNNNRIQHASSPHTRKSGEFSLATEANLIQREPNVVAREAN